MSLGLSGEDMTNHLTAAASPVGGAATALIGTGFSGAEGGFELLGALEVGRASLGGHGFREGNTGGEQDADQQGRRGQAHSVMWF